MKLSKSITMAVAGSVLITLAACNNSTDQSSNTSDTNKVDTRRYSDTTTNPVTGDTPRQAGDTTGSQH